MFSQLSMELSHHNPQFVFHFFQMKIEELPASGSTFLLEQ